MKFTFYLFLFLKLNPTFVGPCPWIREADRGGQADRGREADRGRRTVGNYNVCAKYGKETMAKEAGRWTKGGERFSLPVGCAAVSATTTRRRADANEKDLPVPD